MKRYLLFAFSTACLAYSLYFIFAVVYQESLMTFSDKYFYGFMLHVPAWLMAFLIGGIFNQRISRVKYLNQTIKLATLGILILFTIPIFKDNLSTYFNYLVLIFYLFDFLLCYLIFVKLLNKETSKVENID